jgi:signal transduction histidine kinase
VDIHDGLGQNLLVIRNKILLSLKKKSTIAKLEDTLESLLEVTTEALDDTRAMSHNLRPPILNTMGLTVAIQSLVEKMRVSTSVKINLDMKNSIDGLIQKELEINVYRILQEGFNNAFKHAQATKINIGIVEKAHELHINFSDNGNGFEQGKAKMGQGLLGIKERVSLMKGTLFINSENQKGTQIIINIPVKI